VNQEEFSARVAEVQEARADIGRAETELTAANIAAKEASQKVQRCVTTYNSLAYQLKEDLGLREID
jgi:hypothetical protein